MIKRLLFTAVLFLAASSAGAQINWITPNGNTNAEGKVNMCLNGSSQAVPCSSATPSSTGIADGADVAQGTTTDGACAGDATSGCTLLSRLSRIAARITTLIGNLGSPFQAGGSIGNTSFGATGTTSNASSGVATSSTNIPAVNYNYVWNGATWDQAQGLSAGTKSALSTQLVSTGVVPSSDAAAGTTQVSSSALAANQVISAAAANLYSFEVAADSTLSGAAWWIMIYNATSAPGDGAVTPSKCYAMASGTTSFSGAFPTPIRFTTGITIGVSTTGCFTKTASTHAFISGDYQ